jgi:TolB-like protein/Tfp pilus assembly protein PilF
MWARKLYREARRRKVFRTAGLYIIGAWLTLQVAALTFPGFGIPDAAIRALILAAVLGFPLALLFGWLFEIGPGGIRRTASDGPAESPAPRPLASADYAVLAAFAAVAGALAYQTAQEVRDTPEAAAAAVPVHTMPEAGARLPNSIAVLPFANISNDPDNEYFCDGVSEEILDRLASVRELNVIGRTSSFAFKGSDYGVDRISGVLGVRYVLQGSVRKAGNQLRISAQLLDADGRQLWNQSFDRQLENVFEIQSEIAGAVATTVASQVAIPEAGYQPNIEAYEHYLTGRTLLHLRDADRAQAEFESAIGSDPGFAEAYAELAIAQALGGTQERMDHARRSIERALQLKPRLLRAWTARGFVLMASAPPDLAGAERAFREVLAQDPSMSDALLWLRNTLFMQGRTTEARAILERAALIDPLHPSIAATLAATLQDEGRTDEAERIYDRLLAQPIPGPMALSAAAGFYGSTGQLGAMTARSREAALREPSFHYLFFLLQACAVLGDWELADGVNERLLRLPPGGPGRIYRRTFLPALKDQTDVAMQRVREAFDELKLTLDDLDPFAKAIAGSHFARGGNYAAAIEALEPVVNVDSPYRWPNPDLVSPPAHSLAWSYLHTGADAKAEHLLAAAARECGAQTTSLSPGGERLQICAEMELLRGDIEQALDGLEQAIQAGWRAYYLQEHDPYWASVANDPRYRALMAKVKADVDRQRDEVQRLNPTEEFLAQLDAALTATAR